jgi:hypothetical protein
MQSSSPPIKTFRDYRAPSETGSALIEPKLAEAGALWKENRSFDWRRESWWASLRRDGRTQLLADAIRYTSAYRSTSWVDTTRAINDDGSCSVLMAGHQPELFHAGVWFKNFALDRIAKSIPVIPVNLVVDNDVAMRRGIRVPTLDAQTGLTRFEIVNYDEGRAGIPYEQLMIEDRQQFDSFDKTVRRVVASLVPDPCVTQLWKHAREAIQRCGVAGCALAQARHALESDLGLQTLEIPLSVAVRSVAFAKFLLSILIELPRFHQCYNGSAAVYRHAHGIRSTAHPVPNLASDGDWYEAPLWIYGDDSPVRRAAWIRYNKGALVISDRSGRECVIDSPGADAGAEKLASAQCNKWKIRPRALITTMYSRLVLSDLFLHGIGGGKYDQLGDQITQAFFGITPPQFMVMSATVRLPGIEAEIKLSDEEAVLKRRIRESVYQPELFARQASISESLVKRKRELLSHIPERGEKLSWHRELESLNRQMSESLHDERSELAMRLRENELRQASQSILASREHPFCVFSLEHLTSIYESVLSR